MRIPANCRVCMEERAAANGGVLEITRDEWYLLEPREDNAYSTTCKNGHTIRFALQNLRHQILYESGVVAMLVGFHREAVSSIASAWESFVEFTLRVFSERDEVDPAQFEIAWSHARRSERRYGAFLLFYLMMFKRPFAHAKRVESKLAPFRNDVIHDGVLPTREKVEEYAKSIYELIRDTHAELLALAPEAVTKVELRDVADARSLLGEPIKGADGRYRSVGSTSYAMMLTGIPRDAPPDFESRLRETESKLWLWGYG